MFYHFFFLLSKLTLPIFFNKVNYVFPKKKKRYTFMSFTHYSCPFLLSFQFLLGSAVFLLFFLLFFLLNVFLLFLITLIVSLVM